MQYGFNTHEKWDVDEETLVTLHDMSKLQGEYTSQGNKEKLEELKKDLKKVMRLGKKIKDLNTEKKYKNAKSEFDQIKDINDEIALYRQKRDKYDEKYETTRFWEMMTMDNYDNNHDEKLKNLLLEDQQQLER